MIQHLFLFKLFSVLITFLAAAGGGAWPLWRRYQLKFNVDKVQHIQHKLELPTAEAIAAGIFLAAGLLHMLADSTNDFISLGYHYPLSYLIVAITFLTLLGLEHIAGQYAKSDVPLKISLTILTAVMLIIHSLLEGLALGVSASFSIVFMVFIAIISHKSAASFALSIALSRSSLSLWSAVILFLIFSLMTPLGILLGNYVSSDHHVLLVPIFTALAAGTFLYMGTLHGFERASLIHRCCNLKEFFFMLCGFTLMALVAMRV